MAELARSFPILQVAEHVRSVPTPVRLHRIPWVALAPHEAQALKNHSQTLERLAERGGLSPKEALAVLRDIGFDEVKETKPIEIEQAVLDLCLRAVVAVQHG